MASQREYRDHDPYDRPRRPSSDRRPRKSSGRKEQGRPRYREEYDPPVNRNYQYPDEEYERKRPRQSPPKRESSYQNRPYREASYHEEAYQERPYQERPRPRKQYPSDGYYSGQGRPNHGRPRQQPPMNQTNQLQEAKKSTNKKIFLFIYNLVFYTLMIGIILSAVMFSFSEKSNAAIMGYRFYQVLTNSMVPQADSPKGGFYAGDIVIVKMMDGSKVKKDDIVTFQVGDGDRYLTHRMVKRLDELNGEKGDYIVTKGDANNSADPPILAERVFGKVVFVIPKMGSFLAFVRENPWLCLVCVLSTFGFFLVLKAYFLQPEQQKKRSTFPR